MAGSPGDAGVLRRSAFVPGDPPLLVVTEVGRIGVCYLLGDGVPGVDQAQCAARDRHLVHAHELADVTPPSEERPIEVTQAQGSASVDRICVAV